MGLSFQVNQARSLSLHFGDEEDHIAFAYYVNRGYQLHKDLQNNHQPTVYFLSAVVQKLTHPQNIFMLIKRHRQAMFMYGLIWSAIMVWRFRWLGWWWVLIFEFLKYFLLGNVNLMETQAVYPAVYVLTSALQVWFKNKKIGRLEGIFLGVSYFLIIFNMIPLWPWLVIIGLGFLIKTRKNCWWQLLGLAGSMVILFNFLFTYDVGDWFRETVWNNFFYAIPDLSPYKSSWDWLKMVFFPFLSFFTKESLQAKFISLFITGWLTTTIFLFIKKDKKAWLMTGLYGLLMLANNRVLSPGAAFYHGFHLLPWMGMMILIFVFSLKYLFEKFPKVKKYLGPVFFIWLLALMLNKNMPYFWLNTDVEHEYYVNYSTLDDMNFAIKTLVNPGDRLAVTANEPILYWNSGAELATRQIVYGSWEPKIKELNDRYNQVFLGNNPPEIIYGGDEPVLLKEKYEVIWRNDKPTELFVRKDKYSTISDEQWQSLKTRGFKKALPDSVH